MNEVRVLIVDDSEADAILLTRELRRAGYSPTSKRVDTAEGMDQALTEHEWDVVLCDYVMPYFSGPAALEVLHKKGLDIPLIVVSGQIGEDTAVEAMRAGASDYIMKGNLKRLVPAVRRALEEARERARLTKAEEELKQYHEHLEQLVQERTANLTEANQRLEQEITERKRLEGQLLAYERLATIGQLSGSIAHEIRNPLGTIGSSAFLLERKLSDADDNIKKHLLQIRSAVNSATAVIESLLDLTRIKAPGSHVYDLREVVAGVISNISESVTVVRDFPGSEVRIAADRAQLRMAFSNIVTNAVQAMESKGCLTVRILYDASQAEVSFADSGPGIDRENLQKLFQPLFTTKAKGIGLGLTIAKLVVEKHGGTIEVKSEHGKGTMVLVRLPLNSSS